MTPDKPNTIPPMVNPLGKYWPQPSADCILIDNTYALMSVDTFERLVEYNLSHPSGVYAGKMWKSYSTTQGEWFLMWYGNLDLMRCSTNRRAILVV